MRDDEREPGAPEPDMVCIFRTGDEALAAIVRSILDGESISYVASSAGPPELFEAGRSTGSLHFGVGSVDFLVASADADRARTVLDALQQGFLTGGAAEEKDSPNP